jgi:hypothetical protein
LFPVIFVEIFTDISKPINVFCNSLGKKQLGFTFVF